MFPAGWYPDLDTPNQVRYWDGTQWTRHTSNKMPANPNKIPRPGLKLAGLLLVIPFAIACILGVVFMFMSVMLGEAVHMRDDVVTVLIYRIVTILWLLMPITQLLGGLYGAIKHYKSTYALILNIILVGGGLIGTLLLGTLLVSTLTTF